MLYLGSSLIVKDNSGANIAQIINLRKKKTYKSTSLSSCSICLTVIKKDNINLKRKKSLKKKSLINMMIATVKKKCGRKNGFYIHFHNNVGIPYEHKNKRLQVFATRVFTPVLKELKKKKINKHIVLKAKKAI